MLENLKNKTVILASQSPRRRELLEMTKINFRVEIIPDIVENYPEILTVTEIPLYIAQQKQKVYKHFWSMPNYIVIAADTIVSIENHILGKPANKKEALQMLKILSGKTHQVITGVSIKSNVETIDFTEITEVTFKSLTDSVINYYIDNYNTLDKAGAYGIQEWIGLTSISRINGSYFNVMGLPIDRLYDELSKVS